MIIRLQLLKKNPQKRLGAGERDANEVKGEKFFEVNHFPLLSLTRMTLSRAHTSNKAQQSPFPTSQSCQTSKYTFFFIYSGLRPILHPSFVEIHSVVFLDRGEHTTSLAEVIKWFATTLLNQCITLQTFCAFVKMSMSTTSDTA